MKLAILLLIAFSAGLRCATSIMPAMIHPDEVFQYLEQAHRLVFGYGVVPWEYSAGMRSWVYPVVLSVPMRIGDLVDPGGQLYLFLPKVTVALVSVSLMPAAYMVGRRMSRMHGLVAFVVAGVWFEFIYFAGHTLTESIAVPLILTAGAILSDEKQDARMLAIAGALLGLGFIMRFHYAPAIAVLVAMSCRTAWRERWLPIVMGGVSALLLGGATDLAMGQVPFGWIHANFYQNIVLNRAAEFGLTPAHTYFIMMMTAWGFWMLPMLLFMIPVVPRYRPLFWMAVVNILIHSLIGHKEYRFVFLSTATIVLLSAIGSVECLRFLSARAKMGTARLLPLALVALWVGVSAALAATAQMDVRWQSFSAGLSAARALSREPGLCGVALVGLRRWETGGYTFLHRPVPLYSVAAPDEPDPETRVHYPAYNAIMASTEHTSQIPLAYKIKSCHTSIGSDTAQICAFVRSGGCTPTVGPDQQFLKLPNE